MKFRKRVVAVILFISMFSMLSPEIPVLAGEIIDENPYGIEAEMDRMYYFYGDTDETADTAKLVVTCSSEWKEKLQYQWKTESDTGEMCEIEGATESTFTPTVDILKKSNSFLYCYVTLEGVSKEEFTYIRVAYYLKYNDIVDISDKEYTDDIDGKDGELYVRRIEAEEQTKGLELHFKQEENVPGLSIYDAKGNAFYINEEKTLEVQGNYCVVVIFCGERQKSLGIESVEKKDVFTRKAIRLQVYSGNELGMKPGDVLDLTNAECIRYYNDGTEEKISASSLSWDREQKLQYGTNVFEILDRETGISTICYVYLPLELQWKVKPADTIFTGDRQVASVKLPDGVTDMKYIWELRDNMGKIAAEIEDDTEPEIVLPELAAGEYELYCYYYNSDSEFDEDQYIVTYFRVEEGAKTETPAPSNTPETPAPSGTPETPDAPSSQNKVKKPGRAVISLKKKNKKVVVRIKKCKNASGYQIMIAKNKSFTKGKRAVFVKKKSYSLKARAKKQKYFIKVRGYNKGEKGKKVYGRWSKVWKAVLPKTL